MDLILHIGTEKTGSTAIQEHLARHREDLLASRIGFPDFLDSNNHRALASVFIADSLDDDYLRARHLVEPAPRRRHRDKLLRALGRQLESLEGEVDRYLISAEHFHSRLLTPEEVRSFTDAVTPMFDRVRVICYLRRQDRMALSFYTQKLRAGYIPPTILPIANVRRRHPDLPPYFDFEALLDRWADAVGPEAVEPVIYSRASLIDGDVVADFYHRIGCPLPESAEPPRANESLSCAGQMALLAFNRAHGGDLESRSRCRPEREQLNRFLQSEARGPGILPSHAEAEEFLRAFAPSNGRIARKWFDRDELFPDDAGEYPEREAAPDWEAAAELLARFAMVGEGSR